MHTTLLLNVTLGFALASQHASSDDWPEFRGPTGQGIARTESLPAEWSPTKNVVWRRELPGRGWSSPIVVDHHAYLTTSITMEKGSIKDESLQALCIDAGSGKIVWQKEVFLQDGATAAAIHGKNSHASPTPLIRDGRLYVHFGHQGIACLNLSGAILWRNTRLHYAPVHGNGGSPILVDDALIFSCDGGDKAFVAALDYHTGKVLWTTDRDKAGRPFSFSTPLLIAVDGRKQVVSAGSDLAAAYDPATGREIWRVRYSGYSVVPRPVYGHGLVFICTGFGSPVLLAIRPDGDGDITRTHVVWKARRSVSLTPSPLLVGDEVYIVSDNGVASCLDAKTGAVCWQERIGGAYSASPLYAAAKIYLPNEEGMCIVLQAGREFKVIARNSLGERTLASYAAADGALFIRTEKALYRIQSQ
jgi:outer membrane protein assembly factor BamB